MDSFFGVVRLFILCGTFLFIAMLLLAHLPKSPLRTLLVQVCGWAGAALCGVYIASPIDVIPDVLFPFGFIDDAIALFFGIKSALAAWNAGKVRADANETEMKDVDRKVA